MLTCPRCQFLASATALNCSRCRAPLAHLNSPAPPPYGIAPPASPYGSRSRRGVAAAGAAVVALVAVVAFVVGRQQTAPPHDLDALPVEAPRVDGWARFHSPDGVFAADFPSVPIRSEAPLEGLVRTRVRYDVSRLGVGFSVWQLPAPEYVPPYEVGKKLEGWFTPIWVKDGAVLESATTGLSPRGDQIFDAVVIDATGRHWIRTAMWEGSLLFAVGTTEAARPPSDEQVAAWRRFRDSLGQ